MSTSPPNNTANARAPSDDMPLLPARMLNEFSYCPRLAYLEWVQGEWAENKETASGTFVHRVVDQTDTHPFPPASEQLDANASSTNTKEKVSTEVFHTRSLLLASEREGLIAKLDLLEVDGQTATPIDYKRGAVPNVPEGAYEPERVQLCAQALILRDQGFDCQQGVIYYAASKRRVIIPIDDALVERTRALLGQFLAVARNGICPPPLVDSPKCPKCSLVGICLPDETQLLRHLNNDPTLVLGETINVANNTCVDPTKTSLANPTTPISCEELLELGDGNESENSTDDTDTLSPHSNRDWAARIPPRRLIPTQSHALPLYVQQQGATVGKSGERLTIKDKGESIADVRLLDVSQLCIFGNITVTAPAIRELNVRAIPICHFSYGGWFHGITSGLSHKNVELRMRQYALAVEPDESLRVARHFILGKIKNCRTLLRRHLNPANANVLRQLHDSQRQVARADSADVLLGVEGAAARDYFAAFFPLFMGNYPFVADHRNRRPPRDPINAVLSFLYALLTKELTIVLQAVGFDPMLGFLHRPRYGRPSLALDLAEEFRPIIADSVALTAFNNGELRPDHFIQRAGACAMAEPARRAVIAAYERRLTTEIVHPIFGYKIAYRRILEVQARLLARYITGEIAHYPSFRVR